MHITLSPQAAEKVRGLLDAQPAAPATAGLRIDVVAGGCSGHQYRLALDDTQADDGVAEIQGVRVLVAESASRFVRGARVEYDASSGGFRIDNPNVTYSCGCGSSFQLRDDAPQAAV
jgi:iron-sulfur cluster assembly protein